MEATIKIPSFTVTDNGFNALMWAATDGHDGVAKILLQNIELDINCRDIDNRTALMLASRDGHDKVVKMLLENSAIDVQTKVNYI